MATIDFTVKTDDGTTVNVAHTVTITDENLGRFLNAMKGTYNPAASNSAIILTWVQGNMLRANTFVAGYETSQIATPNSVGFSIS